MLEPCSESLFDFEFEKGWMTSGACRVSLYFFRAAVCTHCMGHGLSDLSKREVQALMFAEMLAYRPSAGKIWCTIFTMTDDYTSELMLCVVRIKCVSSYGNNNVGSIADIPLAVRTRWGVGGGGGNCKDCDSDDGDVSAPGLGMTWMYMTQDSLHFNLIYMTT